MFEPITFDRLETALTMPFGWIELGLVLACFFAGWLVDRRFEKRSEDAAKRLRLPGGVVRFAMPIVALLLLVVARAIWRRYLPILFLDVGVLLAVDLAGIRIVVYTLRRLVPNADWLKGSERTVAYGVWTLVALHALGITPQIAAEMDALRLPLGKQELSLLTIAKGMTAVIVTIAVTLWLSGLIEQRLMKTQFDLSQRALASKFVRAMLLIVGVLIAFQAIGFDLTLLSVFGGALGVGIGLGLQKLELGVWIRDPENGQLNLKSELNREIWKTFQQAGIGVPVKMQEVRVFSGTPLPPAGAPDASPSPSPSA